MNYLKSTILYTARFWWRLLVVLLPVAVFAAWLFRPFTPVFAVWELMSADTLNPDDLWAIFSVQNEFYYVFLYVAFLLVCTAVTSYAFVAIYRHFRTGKFSIRTPIAYVNSAFLPVLKVLTALAVYLVGYRCLSVGILVLVGKAVVGLQIPYAVFVVFTVLLLLAGTVFGLVLLSTPLLMVSQMFVFGYSFVEGWSTSAKLLGGADKRKVFGAVIAPALFITVVDVVLLLCSAAAWVCTLVLTVVLIVTFAYYVALSLTLAFDLTGTERRDLTAQQYRL